MTALIIEPDSRGHRLEYVALLQQLIPGSTWVGSPEAVEAYLSKDSDDEGAKLALGAPMLQHHNSFVGRLRDLRSVRTLAISQSQEVYFTNGDEYVFPLLLLRVGRSFNCPTSMILMRPPKVLSVNSLRIVIKQALKKTAVWMLRILGVKVKNLAHPLSSDAWRPHSLPDPSGLIGASRPLAPRHTHVASTASIHVASVGVQTRRKNVDALARAATKSDFHLTVAGEFEDLAYFEELRVIAADCSRISIRNETLSPSELSELLENCDCLALLYSNKAGSSGLLTHALMAGKPVIGYKNLAVNEVINEWGSGTVVDDLSESTIKKAIIESAKRDLSSLSQEMATLHTRCVTAWSSFAAGG